MRLTSFFYIGFVLLTTTSCSSMYDVWQGYDDIEPEELSAKDFQSPRQERGELDEVVVRAKIENNFVNTPAVRQEITTKQIEEIYEKARLQSESDLDFAMDVPEYPPVSAAQELQLETIVQEAPTADTTAPQTEEVSADIEVTEDTGTEPAYTPDVTEEVIESDTIVIGGDFADEGVSYDYTGYEQMDEVIFVGGDDAHEPMMPSETENMIPVGAIEAEIKADIEAIPTPVIRTPPAPAADPYQPLIIGDDYSDSIDEFDTVMIGEETSSVVVENNASGTSVLATTIKYNKGSDKLSTKDIKDLKAVVNEYRNNPTKVKVMGYAVNYAENLSVDKAMELMDLATRRADKVMAQLVKHGVNASDIEVAADALDGSSGNKVDKKNVTEIYFEF